MDTRITPFGEHPDGGKISELDENKPVPDHMMPISFEAQKILEEIPQDQRVDFILNSENPNLQLEKDWLVEKLTQQLLGNTPLTKKTFKYNPKVERKQK